MDQGQEIPEELLVDVPDGGTAFYEAFWWCSRRRGYHGMSGTPMPIAASEMLAYADAYGLDREETMLFVDRLDIAWLTWASDTAKQRASRRPAKAARPEPRGQYEE